MKKLFRMSPEARNDLKKAGRYFGEIRSTLADEFAEENQKILERIKNTPEQFPVIYKKEVHRAVGKKFSFSTFFVDREEDTTVIAVLHQSSNPKRWKNRADKVLKHGK